MTMELLSKLRRQVDRAWAHSSFQNKNTSVQDASAVNKYDTHKFVAIGVLASWTTDEMVALMAECSTAIVSELLLPLNDRMLEDESKFHFTLLLVTTLLEDVHRVMDAEDKAQDKLSKCVEMLCCSVLVPAILDPNCVHVHPLASSTIKSLLALTQNAPALVHTLSTQLHLNLTTSKGADASKEAIASAMHSDKDESAIFRAIRSSYQVQAELWTWFYTNKHDTNDKADEWDDAMISICQETINTFSPEQPWQLEAVAIHMLSSCSISSLPQRCVQRIEERERDQQAVTGKTVDPAPAMLFLLCRLVRMDVKVVLSSLTLRSMIARGLACENDKLVRKQALAAMKTALAAFISSSKHQKNGSQKQASPYSTETWENFLAACEVIHMHHEQHLIEQVWPQVDALIQMGIQGFHKQDETQLHDTGCWPVALTFEWMQSVLIRILLHENPVVRRLFVSRFMHSCIKYWESTDLKHSLASNISSFVDDPTFHSFVQYRLLRFCNDPLLYKPLAAAKEFQQLLTQFLTLFLRTRLSSASTEPGSGSTAEDILSAYVHVACNAVFGPDTSNHSPEAFISMLQVFESTHLQQLASAYLSDGRPLLGAQPIESLRFVLDVYIMPSFAQTTKFILMRAAQALLTTGFCDQATLPLSAIARLLCIFSPEHLLSNNSVTLVALRNWLLLSSSASKEQPKNTFMMRLADAVHKFLADDQNEQLSVEQLARLIVLTGDTQHVGTEDDITELVLEYPLASLLDHVSTSATFDGKEQTRAVWLVGMLEKEVEILVQETPASCTFSIRIKPDQIYKSTPTTTIFSRETMFTYAYDLLNAWVAAQATSSKSSNTSLDVDSWDAEPRRVDAIAMVLARMATYAMDQEGNLSIVEQLNPICKVLTKIVFQQEQTSSPTAQNIALRMLAILSSQTQVLDVLDIFDASDLLPQLVQVCFAPASERAAQQMQSKWNITIFTTSKWAIIHHVIQASTYVPRETTKLLLETCVDAFGSAGTDPDTILHLVQSLARCLRDLAPQLRHEAETSDVEDVDMTLDGYFKSVWTSYQDVKNKPDDLTRGVIYCIFQPVLLHCSGLTDDNDSLFKRWYRTVWEFGALHRPNVIFHLTSRFVQIWRMKPRIALAFQDEILELLFYKEPQVSEKQRLKNTNWHEMIESMPSERVGVSVKDKFVRILVLGFLDDVPITKEDDDLETFMTTLLERLLQYNLTEDGKRQYMINSDGFGRKVRCWQAICVLSRHITSGTVESVNQVFWQAFGALNLPEVRFYMEVVAMQLAVRFPATTVRKHLIPSLGKVNQSPQIATSLLLVAGYLVTHALDSELLSKESCELELFEAMLPWLSSGHGHARVLTQFAVGQFLPRLLAYPELSLDSNNVNNGMNLRFLEHTTRFLSENKECKRMLRRQQKQLSDFRPSYECSLLGVLSSSIANEFDELVPHAGAGRATAFTEELKAAMNELYAQFQREYFNADMSPDILKTPSKVDDADEGNRAGGLLVQRKIDVHSVLLEESVLPVAWQRSDMPTTSPLDLNARRRQRQSVIMCASLVDKAPNLGGLARTCEIFNAEKLIVPDERIKKDETFQTISVTAHKWVPIEEVSPANLTQALVKWKQDGYTIVGVEQTADSEDLSSFSFPDMAVIVLGKEKEGIPVDVLQLVDVCVEIPQFGVIRSLNVHVSGALLLWSYTQQQLLKDSRKLV